MRDCFASSAKTNRAEVPALFTPVPRRRVLVSGTLYPGGFGSALGANDRVPPLAWPGKAPRPLALAAVGHPRRSGPPLGYAPAEGEPRRFTVGQPCRALS
jgi:hypothetical protein